MDANKPAPPLPAVANSAAPRPAATTDPAAARSTAENFEAFFLSQVFENMFSGVSADPMFGGGSGEAVYRSLLLHEYSKVAAHTGNGGIGVADAVQREILRLQETK